MKYEVLAATSIEYERLPILCVLIVAIHVVVCAHGGEAQRVFTPVLFCLNLSCSIRKLT